MVSVVPLPGGSVTYLLHTGGTTTLRATSGTTAIASTGGTARTTLEGKRVDQITIGRAITCQGVLHDSTGTPSDPPGDVYIQLIKPDATTAEYKYGVDPEVTRNGAGDYQMTVAPTDDEGGRWEYSLVGLTATGGYWSRVTREFAAAPTAFAIPPAGP